MPKINQSEIPQNSKVERANERQKLSEEGPLKRGARLIKESVQSPETVIGQKDAALFRAAGFNDDEIRWSSEIKRLSRGLPDLNAYDLVYAHALLNRDLKDLGAFTISKNTEEFIDDILLKIFKNYEPLSRYLEQSKAELGLIKEGKLPQFEHSIYDLRIAELFHQYQELCKRSMALEEHPEQIDSRLGLDKATLLTKWLNVVHEGGNSEVVDLFKGYPEPPQTANYKTFQKAQSNFLSRLNNLGQARQNILKKGGENTGGGE